MAEIVPTAASEVAQEQRVSFGARYHEPTLQPWTPDEDVMREYRWSLATKDAINPLRAIRTSFYGQGWAYWLAWILFAMYLRAFGFRAMRHG